MAIRSSTSVFFRFIVKHWYVLVLAMSMGIAIWGSTLAWNATQEIKDDRKRSCSNSLDRANDLRDILTVALSRSSNPESRDFFQTYLNEKLPPLFCDNDGVLSPVGSSGQG